jgi:hypothetical protein
MGDGQLRELAGGENVECHGVLWLLDMMEEEGTGVQPLYDGLFALAAHPRCRLPRRKITTRLERYRIIGQRDPSPPKRQTAAEFAGTSGVSFCRQRCVARAESTGACPCSPPSVMSGSERFPVCTCKKPEEVGEETRSGVLSSGDGHRGRREHPRAYDA